MDKTRMVRRIVGRWAFRERKTKPQSFHVAGPVRIELDLGEPVGLFGEDETSLQVHHATPSSANHHRVVGTRAEVFSHSPEGDAEGPVMGRLEWSLRAN